MGVGPDFLKEYERMQVRAVQRVASSAVGDLAAWRGFVASCAEGYDDVLPEYFHDLSVRDALERGLQDASLRKMAGFEEFARAVHEVDEQFREIATVPIRLAEPDAFAWWHHVVPARGGEEFARDLEEHFSVVIQVVDDD